MEAFSTVYASVHQTQGAGPLGLTVNTLGHPSNSWLLITEPGLTAANPQQSSAAQVEWFSELYHPCATKGTSM